MQEIIKIEHGLADDFGLHLFYLDMLRNNPERYIEIQREYQERIAQLPAPSLNWDDTKGYIGRFHEITTGNRFKLFSETPKDDFMPHFLTGMLWKKPIIVVGQLNILAGVLHRIAEEDIIRVNKQRKFKLTAPHFVTISADPIEKYKPITAHDLSKALNQGFGMEAAEIVDSIIEYISK